MAEPFGIISGAIGIAAAFTTCVDIFEYVQLGRRFGKDYQTNQLRVTLLRLRLSRWGEAVNIYSDPQLGNPQATKAEIQAAKDTLLQILIHFEDSNKISAKFKIKADAGAIALPDDPTDFAVVAINNKMRDLAIKRQKGASFVKVTSWAIHHGAALKTLIGDISELINDLEALFPALEAQKQLAKKEIADVKDQQEMQALESASEGLDSLLHEAASEVSGHKYKNIDIDGGKNANVMSGNFQAADYKGGAAKGASNLYDGVKIKGTEGLVVLSGDKLGGVDPFARLPGK
ncbi:small s protein [Hyaloscypha finlandica]|nr:small s protein [Hyaloscypha finlandica]